MGCSRLIFDITQSLLRIGFLQEARIAGDEARKVVPRIREQYEDYGLDPLFDVFRTFVVLGRIEDALTLAQEISSVYEIPLTDEKKNLPLRLVSKSLAEDIGDFGRATQVVQQIADPQVKEYALGDICEALARAGHFSEAVEVAQEISDNSTGCFRSFFLIQICEELCERKQYRQATSVCEAMNMDALSFRCSALLRIAEGLAKEQQIDEMRMILKEAMGIPNKDKDWSLSRASEVLAQAGEFDESLETAKRISERHYYHTALSAISEALAARGQIDRALEIAHECEGVESEALCGISQALAKTGRFEESKTIALKIADANKRSDALAYLGTVLAGEAKAVQVFQVAMKIPDEYGYKRHDTFDVLTKTLASRGRVDEAIQTSLGWDSVNRVLMLAHIYWAIQHRESS